VDLLRLSVPSSPFLEVIPRVFFRDRGLRMNRLRRVELFAGRHFDLNDLEVLACQRGVVFSYLDIGMANYFRS
jgi:hypothetical protein